MTVTLTAMATDCHSGKVMRWATRTANHLGLGFQMDYQKVSHLAMANLKAKHWATPMDFPTATPMATLMGCLTGNH